MTQSPRFIYGVKECHSFIIMISPESGKIVGWIDLKEINQEDKSLNANQVLNGIAYNNKTKNLLVTGKNRSKIYEIKLKQ